MRQAGVGGKEEVAVSVTRQVGQIRGCGRSEQARRQARECTEQVEGSGVVVHALWRVMRIRRRERRLQRGGVQ